MRKLLVLAGLAGAAAVVAKKFKEQHGIQYSLAMGGGEGNYAVGHAYGVKAYPTNLLVTPEGKVLWRVVGFSEIGLRRQLKKAGLDIE